MNREIELISFSFLHSHFCSFPCPFEKSANLIQMQMQIHEDPSRILAEFQTVPKWDRKEIDRAERLIRMKRRPRDEDDLRPGREEGDLPVLKSVQKKWGMKELS